MEAVREGSLFLMVVTFASDICGRKRNEFSPLITRIDANDRSERGATFFTFCTRVPTYPEPTHFERASLRGPAQPEQNAAIPSIEWAGLAGSFLTILELLRARRASRFL